jgi:hypothetical protein
MSLCGTASVQDVHAAAIGLDFLAAPSFSTTFSSGTFGYRFSISSAQTVTGLGFWDIDSSYPLSKAVGLWNSSGTLLGSVDVLSDPVTTVSSGGPSGSGTWFFMPVSISLASGTYIVAATHQNPAPAGQGTSAVASTALGNITTNSLTFLGSAFVQPGNANLTLPTIFDPGSPPSAARYFGGNVQFADATAVPVPAALPLFASGLGLMGIFGWRRKRKFKSAA